MTIIHNIDNLELNNHNKYCNHLMIVDDDKISQTVLYNLTQHYKNSNNVILADNGLQCLTYLSKTKLIDLIFMDINMPYMNGIEATKNIRQTKKFEHYQLVPIVAVTAYETSIIDMNLFNEYIKKPITFEELVTILEKYL